MYTLLESFKPHNSTTDLHCNKPNKLQCIFFFDYRWFLNPFEQRNCLPSHKLGVLGTKVVASQMEPTRFHTLSNSLFSSSVLLVQNKCFREIRIEVTMVWTEIVRRKVTIPVLPKLFGPLSISPVQNDSRCYVRYEFGNRCSHKFSVGEDRERLTFRMGLRFQGCVCVPRYGGDTTQLSCLSV